MSPVTHLLVGWSIANAAPLNRRERALVTVAGVIPDADGFGLVVDFASRGWQQPTELWAKFHHVLGHNLGLALLCCLCCLLLAKKRLLTALLAFVAFHAHLLGDLVGARGPDGEQWPIHYLWPFADLPQWTWRGQWALNAWPNFALTAVLLVLLFYLAWSRGYSLLGLLSTRLDGHLVTALRQRFGQPKTMA